MMNGGYEYCKQVTIASTTHVSANTMNKKENADRAFDRAKMANVCSAD